MTSRRLVLVLGLFSLTSICLGQRTVIAYTSEHFDKENDFAYTLSNNDLMEHVRQRIVMKIEDISGDAHEDFFISPQDFRRIQTDDDRRAAFSSSKEGVEIKYVIEFEYRELLNELGEVKITLMNLDGTKVRPPWKRKFNTEFGFENASNWMKQITLEMEKVVKDAACRDYIVIASFVCNDCQTLVMDLESELRNESSIKDKFFIDLNNSLEKTHLENYRIDGIHGEENTASQDERMKIVIYLFSKSKPPKTMKLPYSLPKIKERLVTYFNNL